MQDELEDPQQHIFSFGEELETPETYQQKAILYSDLTNWIAFNINRTNRLKGWLDKERSNGVMIALMHSELSEALEGERHNNPPSDHIPSISQVEEELADVLIRMLDYCTKNKLNLAKALFLKMEFNKTRPHRHGGKEF